MKKYDVRCKVNDEELADNYIGDYVEAEDEAEAISLAIDYLADQANINNPLVTVTNVEIGENELTVEYLYDRTEERRDTYHSFEAVEIGG
jgi:hypothetical protein